MKLALKLDNALQRQMHRAHGLSNRSLIEDNNKIYCLICGLTLLIKRPSTVSAPEAHVNIIS